MAAVNPPNKPSTRHQLREDTVVTFYARAWEYFDRNRKVVYGALAALVVVIVLVVGYVLYMNQQQEQAEDLLAPAVAAYERGDFRAALDGPDGGVGLLAIVDDYGSTEAGNLATFYAADALYRLGEYDQALEMFAEYDKDENLLGASAIAGEAAVYESKGEFLRAAQLYERAASFFENELSSPQYLMSAARAYEEAGALDEAVQAYEAVREQFPESAQAGTVDLYIARVQAKQAVPS